MDHPKPVFLICNYICYSVNANAGFQDGGFGVQGGVNTPLGGFQGNVGLGQGGSGLNSNLLMTVVIGLGFLSVINIVVTAVTPWLSGFAGGEKPAEDAEKPAEKGRRYQRNINYMAENVLNLIESFSKKNE